jgi:hypothetical protein
MCCWRSAGAGGGKGHQVGQLCVELVDEQLAQYAGVEVEREPLWIGLSRRWTRPDSVHARAVVAPLAVEVGFSQQQPQADYGGEPQHDRGLDERSPPVSHHDSLDRVAI